MPIARQEGDARTTAEPGPTPYARVHAAPEFATLRRRIGRFVIPATVFFLGWYFLYVLCAAFAPRLMSVYVWGWVDVGLAFGLLQFATTFALTMIYARWARRQVDPLAGLLREQWEADRENR